MTLQNGKCHTGDKVIAWKPRSDSSFRMENARCMSAARARRRMCSACSSGYEAVADRMLAFLNLFDCVVGCAMAYYFFFHRLRPVSCCAFKVEYVVLLAIAMLGVTSFLPYILGTRGVK